MENSSIISESENKVEIMESYDSIVVSESAKDSVVFRERQLSAERRLMRDNFGFFAIGSLIYAIVMTFCIYKNYYGITTSIGVIATLIYAYLGLKIMGQVIKAKHVFYGVAITLIGINLFCTADFVILFFDYLAIGMLFASALLSFMYDDSKWSLGEALCAIIDLVFGALGDTFCFEFAKDWSYFGREKSSKSAIIKYVLIGFMLAIPLMAIVLVLLSSADAVFNSVATDLFSDINFGTIICIILVFLGAFFGSYTWFTRLFSKRLNIIVGDKKVFEPIVMIIIDVCLGFIYVFFCAIQIIFLFAKVGDLPDGYTYATYAREGFFQLLFVCFINLMLILIGIKRFKTSKILNVVMTVITACTYIMIISSIIRMFLYISVYQMTLLRVWVLFAQILITTILTGALISIFNKNFHLFKYCVVATTILYILFAFARPANLVARYNLSDAFDEEDIDFYYIENHLNSDAAPALKAYAKRNHTKVRYMVDWDDDMGFRGFNISRYYLEKVR